eukprot:symbB.v1.2.016494.t1/scaffold1254.1/size128712/8
MHDCPSMTKHYADEKPKALKKPHGKLPLPPEDQGWGEGTSDISGVQWFPRKPQELRLPCRECIRRYGRSTPTLSESFDQKQSKFRVVGPERTQRGRDHSTVSRNGATVQGAASKNKQLVVSRPVLGSREVAYCHGLLP